jgi:hypothetical protein
MFKIVIAYYIHVTVFGNGWLVSFIVHNATFNNISAISWHSVLLVEETGLPAENHRHVAHKKTEI